MISGKAVLILVTSCDEWAENQPTGVWFDTFAEPYIYFHNLGFLIEVVSPNGGSAPVDPRSLEAIDMSPAYQAGLDALKHTSKLGASQQYESFDALYVPEGHGALLDLPRTAQVAQLVASFLLSKKPVGLVGHGVAALLAAVSAGKISIDGRRLTTFSQQEEKALGLDTVVPFLLDERLRSLGALVSVDRPGVEHYLIDQSLVTGQNAQAAGNVAVALVNMINT